MAQKILEEYNKKRDFGKTGEPEGQIVEPVTSEGDDSESLRFVVQHHIARSAHYDFRLEWNGRLLSWAVPKGPSYNPRDKRLAVQVEDHPLDYRNFEGTIPKGEYGGGTVMIWDEGFWQPYGNVEEGLRNGMLKFVLKGRRLKGKWALIRLKGKEGERKNNWLLLKERDELARDDSGISDYTTSIRTGRTMAEIEEGRDDKVIKNPFDRAGVQLAKLVTEIPEGDDWLYELKYDGYRILAYVEGNTVQLLTRNGNDYTKRFADVASSLADWVAGRSMVLDGEMVVTDESGKTDFQALQEYMKNPKSRNLTYIVFDLLALDGADLRDRRLIDRKRTLEALMTDAPHNLHYSRHVSGNGEECFAVACEKNMEGIIGKRANSIYSGTRNGDWIKIKCDKRQEFVIGGYTLSDKKAGGISSLLLGVYEDDELVYVGRAGTGLARSDVEELTAAFANLKREDSPFRVAPKQRSNEKITWLEPQLIAEIKFAEWTKENLLRQASYKGLRYDKNTEDIRREKVNEQELEVFTGNLKNPPKAGADDLIIEGVKITNPGKILFEDPVITKGDVVRYYEQAAERMLPYVSNRILSIVRCPKGISQTCFYKKHPGPSNKGIVTIPVTSDEGKSEEYFFIKDKLGLIYEAQMGTLEFHVWGSKVDEIEYPDMMVFDLDPDEGMDLSMVRQGVRDLKGILDELSLVAFLKTSGGKGYHIVVPFNPAVTWDVFNDFARRVAEIMEKKWPDRYTSNVRKAKRAGRIFIDWIRNGRGATSIAPYSLRARKGAKVSMPIDWDELDEVAPDGVDMAGALKRIRGHDPWKDFFRYDQKLQR